MQHEHSIPPVALDLIAPESARHGTPSSRRHGDDPILPGVLRKTADGYQTSPPSTRGRVVTFRGLVLVRMASCLDRAGRALLRVAAALRGLAY